MKKDFEVKLEKKTPSVRETSLLREVPFDILSEDTKVKLSNIAEESSSIAEKLLHGADVVYKQHLLQSLNDLAQHINEVVRIEARELPENYILKGYNKPLIQIERVANVIHFSLNENLPHRITFDKSTKKEKYVFDTQEYYTWCYDSTMNYFKLNEPIFFKEKCAVLFISYYDDSTFPIDHDNVEVKYFIDGALKPFLRGDNGFDLSQFHLAEKDERCHTEIFFGPELDIALFLVKHIDNSQF